MAQFVVYCCSRVSGALRLLLTVLNVIFRYDCCSRENGALTLISVNCFGIQSSFMLPHKWRNICLFYLVLIEMGGKYDDIVLSFLGDAQMY